MADAVPIVSSPEWEDDDDDDDDDDDGEVDEVQEEESREKHTRYEIKFFFKYSLIRNNYRIIQRNKR